MTTIKSKYKGIVDNLQCPLLHSTVYLYKFFCDIITEGIEFYITTEK